MAKGFARLIPRPARLAASRWLAGQASSSFERNFQALVDRPEPIIAGPWLGEVGFELLYWVPFLAWCAERFSVAPERWIVVSRGGTASWYRPFASRYADVFEQVGSEVFREQHDKRVRELGEQKQTRLTAFDEQLIAGAAAKYRLSTWSVLHPSRMYSLLNPFWWGHVGATRVTDHARYQRLPEPDWIGVPAMPGNYVAVKFYFNECFPDTEANRNFASGIMQTLSARGPVVSLSTGLSLDDHAVPAVRERGVRYLPEGIEPAKNLHVQDAIVAGARAFVGTYGGFSYLAPFHHVPSYVFYSNRDGYSAKHLDLARGAFDSIGMPGALHVSDVAADTVELPPAPQQIRG